ncbi:DUF5710 domain-containing protein [Massilia pseudoviolaceinigra]|uniref:DUF5710 domain-containing protein n=1 Tax=Massilia pseudoviolaceinigra TaxID=3057165 RepID=UPI0027966A20|nr:DUF5710 domain-containing protein [Massilia sp. CCM 9206]MDQ1923913.1 DUF5710 domain-containing protein [Massilia sp. CCM 9206]
MIMLKVPYAEKDEAKALGARWNKDSKLWYVPDGVDAAPFQRWVLKGVPPSPAKASGAPAGRVDSYVGKQVVGARYVALEHGCNPFEACPECQPKLAASGWTDARAEVLRIVGGLTT